MATIAFSKRTRNCFAALMLSVISIALLTAALDYSGLSVTSPWGSSSSSSSSAGSSSSSSPPPLPAKVGHIAPPAFFARILPLGASIVWGKASSTGNGFRKPLRDKLRSTGWQVDMVGSKKNGDMRDNDVEAHSGDTINKIHQAALQSTKYQPNIILLNAGTNDCRNHYQTSRAGERLRRLLERLYAEVPGVTIVLATLLQSNSPDVERERVAVNRQIRELYRRQRFDLRRKIVLAEMAGEGGYDYFVGKADLGDTVHPNDRGYAKMAEILIRGIYEALEAGFITEPNMSYWAADENLDDGDEGVSVVGGDKARDST